MRFQVDKHNEPLLYGAFAVVMGLTFLADLFLPLGTSIWVIYLLPTVLTYMAPRPQAPFAVAAVVTLLVVLGFFLAPAGVDPDIAQVNRSLGLLTLWVLAGTSFLFIRNKLAIRRQEWLQDGQVGLSQAMRGEQSIADLGDNIIRFLATYLGAQVGVAFVRASDAFVRRGAYGLPASAPVPERITEGDGLAGQAIREASAFELKAPPDNYLHAGSGLGQAPARHLLIAPAAADGTVQAVLELGFLSSSPPPAAVELLERVGPSIAIALRSARYRERLQDLLEETRQQSEELRRQSEELRASNEELEEHSRNLQESQARLELQQAELEQTNAQLEEQTQMLESQRDDLSRAQTSLERQAGELEQASRYKSEFVANMSHELRTPLNSLLILSRLLADNRGGNLTSEQVKYAETIETAGNDLLALINDILDISKIEAGHLDLQVAPTRVAPLADKLRAVFEPLAVQKGLALRSEIALPAEAEIETDQQRLEQVLKNFLSNALKFTERGEVCLRVARLEDGRLAFGVRDTGIGIPADQQQTIFEAFRQADGTINRKYGGTGLGLSISRELAQLLGGEIRVDSAPGRGSTFTLVLPTRFDASHAKTERPPQPGAVAWRDLPEAPAAVPAAPSRPARPAEDDRERLSGDSRIILVVEDDAAFARILYELAHELGFQCLVADTAEEGVTLARQYLPHAVILDMSLPDHSGLSVLDRLKRDTRTRHIPVHVASVNDYVQAAMALGAVGYMLKPVKRDELVRALQRLEVRFAQRMRRVLIVEDDATQLESLRHLLASREVETLGARSAAECLSQLSSEPVDCMVLDLSLPDASGFEVLEQLRQQEDIAFPPVIVYTGRVLTPDEELRLRRLSKSIIIKGARSPERLLDEVTLFLHQVVAELPEQQQRMLMKSLNRDALLEGRRILVVEDDVRNVFALTGIFEPHGALVQIARNGHEALAALERTLEPGAAKVDLVLMDVMMPGMDGLTAMREIRKRTEWRSLPIIALTAKAMPSDQRECLEAGANDYLAKPLDVEKLLSLARVWMPR